MGRAGRGGCSLVRMVRRVCIPIVAGAVREGVGCLKLDSLWGSCGFPGCECSKAYAAPPRSLDGVWANEGICFPSVTAFHIIRCSRKFTYKTTGFTAHNP